MQPFLAMIMPVSAGHPDQGLPGGQPGGQPPGIWGPTDPRPTPPIHMPPGGGGRPPGIWGGGNVPMPNPPIYFPPEGQEPPLGIWGPTDPRPGQGLPGAQPKPEHPIVLPPDLPEELPDIGRVDWKAGWTQETGWVVVGIPSGEHPAPSAGQPPGQGQKPPQPQPRSGPPQRR